MPDASAFLVFILASLALLIVPGPAVVYIVARSIDQGRSAGIVSALGLAAGSVLLIVAAAFGVSALLAASPHAFDAVRYAGAAYLAFLGVRTLFSGDRQLGLTFSAMGMVTDTVYATVAGTVANRLRDDERFPRVRRISVSVVYLGLALLAVLAHPTK